MNVFRLLGDAVHLASIAFLLHRMRTARSCAGISRKSQELYLLVFLCRYTDLFHVHLEWLDFYNLLLKVLYLGASAYTVWLMRTRLRSSYDAELDSFRVEFLLVPCALLALLVNVRFTLFEILWAFSIYLEAVAILPQLFQLQRSKHVEQLTSHYIACLGAYRGFYLLNWIWRLVAGTAKERLWFVWLAGLAQTALYCDFFYYYFRSKRSGGSIYLPQ